MALAKVKTSEEMARLDAIWAELEAHKDELEEAKRKAEEAERAKAKAEADAKAAAEAETRAKADAERAKQQAEAARANAAINVQGDAQKAIKDAEKTKSEMLFPEDRKAYEKNCKTEAKKDLMDLGLTEEQARDIVIAVLSGKVRHLAMMF